jgi:cob(I)alamin adenosyltransferase
MEEKRFPWFSGKGDKGNTSLLGDQRVPKYHPVPDAYGTIDEATSFLGLARASIDDEGAKQLLLHIQRDLYKMMSELAATPENREKYRYFTAESVQWIESSIEELSTKVTMPREFIVPGSGVSSAALDVARTVIRRAERLVVRLFHEELCANEFLLAYLNRLSSLCFILARQMDKLEGRPFDFAKG